MASMLSPADFENIKKVYDYIYAGNNYVFTRTVKILKSVRIYGQQFGSLRSPRTKNSSFLMAKWAKEDGTIDENGEIVRPGRALYYIMNKVNKV